MANHTLDTNPDWRKVLPPGYTPSLPPDTLAALEVVEAHEQLQVTRILHSVGAITDAETQAGMATASRKLATAVKLLTGGALALAMIALVIAGPAASHAQAAQVPQSSPAASATYRVTLGARPQLVEVRATVYTAVTPRWYCASVWTPRGMLSRYCATTRTFTVPVSIDPRTFPAGRTRAQVVDDGTDIAVADIVFDARRPSAFGTGYYEDRGHGDLYVQIPVTLYNPVLGRRVPQVASPVQIWELTRRGWVLRATLWTNPPGLAIGVIHLGGGVHLIHAVRPDGLAGNVWGTKGLDRVVTVTTEYLDIT